MLSRPTTRPMRLTKKSNLFPCSLPPGKHATIRWGIERIASGAAIPAVQ